MTLNSLRGEYNTILQNPDYAELCVSWISVKSYYLIYNLLLVLDYLITGQESSFNLTHSKSLSNFKNHLENNNLSFNVDIFNKNYSCFNALKLKFMCGFNIKVINVNLQERATQILKKLVSYKLENLQIKKSLKNFRTRKAKEIKDDFLKSETVNMIEFFYWYRIKANYRDLEFLNKDLTNDKFKEFYQNYFELTLNFLNAFNGLINKLSLIRFGENIL